MSKHATAYAEETTHINPSCLYTYNGFIKASGIAKSRIREARLQGLKLETFPVGRRQFVQGAKGIDFIIKLAELGNQS